MLPSLLAAGREWRRRAPSPGGIRASVFVQLDAAFENVPEAGKDRLSSAPRVASLTPCQSLSPAWREKRRTSPAANKPLFRFLFSASREKRRAKSPPMEATAARATCGLEQVLTISRTIIGSSPFSRRRSDLMAIEFVLNVSLLKNNLLSSRRSTFRQRDVNDLSHCEGRAAA